MSYAAARFRPRSVRYRAPDKQDVARYRRLFAAALAAASAPGDPPGALAKARNAVRGRSMPKAQAHPASVYGQLLKLSERWQAMAAPDRIEAAPLLRRLANDCAAIMDAEFGGEGDRSVGGLGDGDGASAARMETEDRTPEPRKDIFE